MNRLNGVYVALALFGAVNLFDALSVFGAQAVDLPPASFFLFSIWVLVRNTVGHTMLMASPALLFGKWSRIPLVLTYNYILIAEAASRYSERVFHADLGSAWLQLLQNSSWHEMLEFLQMSTTIPAVAGVSALLILMIAGSVLLWNSRYLHPSLKVVFVGCAFCLPFVVANCLLIGLQNGNWRGGINQTKYTQFIFHTIKSIIELKGVNSACDHPTLPETIPVMVAERDIPDGVFVLGESSTRNSWHLYGYPRQTTPRMDALCANGEAIKFDDVVGTQPATVEALSLLLTDVSFEDKIHGHWTLAEVYRRAGYRCILISNQYSWSDKSSILCRIFNGCEKRTSPRIEFGKDGYDEKLATILESELENCDNRPTIAFIHLAGIHYPVKPESVHPKEDAYFNDNIDQAFMRQFSPKQRDRLNRYDNGILYEDKVLGMIVEILRKRSRPSFMFFISDHGESPRSATWRSYIDDDVYEIPALVWMSPSYRTKFSSMAKRVERAHSLKLQPDQMTYGLLELGFINLPALPENASFLDDGFRGRNPRLVDKGRRIYSKDIVGK